MTAPGAAVLPDWHSAALDGCGESPGVYSLELKQPYLPGSPSKLLYVACWREQGCRKVIVTDREQAASWGIEHPLYVSEMAQLAKSVGAPIIKVDDIWRLVPVDISKPWGREIWLTGIESRGVSHVGCEQASVPLPWLIALAPSRLLGSGLDTPGLLKILDPLPEEVYGDLYFELHQEKREVYVISEIDSRAWPGGVGEIHYGFDPAVRALYPDDASFRAEFGKAVAEYRLVRGEIDRIYDSFRKASGFEPDQPLPAGQLRSWSAELPSGLRDEEERLRKAMDTFKYKLPLRVGDVVKISPLSPHALQHGVRAVEFQTPVYERKILSFGQKVLTQAHWDTEEAVGMMSLNAGCIESLPLIMEHDAVCLEQVVTFDDFAVQRLTLDPGGRFDFDDVGCYTLIMLISGYLNVAGSEMERLQAALIPASATSASLCNESDSTAVCLLYRPHA